MSSLILWILLRTLTSIIAGIASSIRPLTSIELRIPFYPPSTPISDWLDRAFLSPWLRWDAEWYQRIVTQGYSATDGTSAFHPLYPWLSMLFVRIGISPVLSLLIISSLAGIFMFYTFFKLAQIDLQPDDAFYALMLFALAPLSFVLFAPYPEALFLLFSVLCLYFARKKTWWLAGIMGGLAVLTRQQGIFLLIPVAWEFWEDFKSTQGEIKKRWRDLLALGLIPFGFIVWLLYRGIFLSDVQLTWGNIQEFIYSFLISNSASEVVQSQQFVWPWQALYLSINKLITQPDADIIVDLVASVSFVVLLGLVWRKLRPSYRIYSFTIVLISFSFYTGPIHPAMGLPRHLYLAFPIFIGLAGLVNKPLPRMIVNVISALGMAFLLVMYVIKAWVP